ncbi:DUF6473 family protein [Rubellimicrobium arenae]|uniref:DUF6473 family protein n=1 Tax=Rubellimicrobium arenae TaxID=2817372 RepID=UPI001B30358B|nr:DUF6473 family protein [Rubellimicrobium arenae]
MLASPELGYETCRYEPSRAVFRGPGRPLRGRFTAFVGGSTTLGQGVVRPFPALVEEAVGGVCVNFGQANASVEAFLADPVVPAACRAADVTVLEVMGAANLSNRLYTVHPRRNDRFLRVSPALRAIFPEADTAEVCFTRHLLRHLYEVAPDRFDIVEEELRLAWLARMQAFLDRIGSRVILLRIEGDEVAGPFGPAPLFVTDRMVEALRPLVRDVVTVAWRGGNRKAAAHREVAAALEGPVAAALAEALRASR